MSPPSPRPLLTASDVIYIPTDNTAASNTEAIANVVHARRRCPSSPVRKASARAAALPPCPSATTTWATRPVRWPTEILANGADVSTMPVEFAPNVTKKYNAANCEALGITPPDGYEAIAELKNPAITRTNKQRGKG